MLANTEQALIGQLQHLLTTHQLCNGIYPTVKLSDCATAALREFIRINICNGTQSSPPSRNYKYLLDLLQMIFNNPSLLCQTDAAIWDLYKQSNSNVPGSPHQLPGLAKALIKGCFYP